MASEIAPSLSLVFAASLHQGVVPQDWKLALVTPLFKKGSRKEPTNYQPISLTREVHLIGYIHFNPVNLNG